MPVATNSVYLATVVGDVFNQRIMLTLTYRVAVATGSIDEIDAQNLLADQLATPTVGDFLDSYLKVLSTSYVCRAIWAQQIFPVRFRKSVEGIADLPGSGGASETTNNSAAIQLVTRLAGRKQNGIKKIGPIPTVIAAIEDGVLTPGYVGTLATLALNMRAPITVLSGDLSFVPCIYHRGATPASDDVVGSVVQLTARVNRRRTVGLGI